MTGDAPAGTVPAEFALALAARIYACYEILARLAERRRREAVVLTETDYCPLGEP